MILPSKEPNSKTNFLKSSSFNFSCFQSFISIHPNRYLSLCLPIALSRQGQIFQQWIYITPFLFFNFGYIYNVLESSFPTFSHEFCWIFLRCPDEVSEYSLLTLVITKSGIITVIVIWKHAHTLFFSIFTQITLPDQ